MWSRGRFFTLAAAWGMNAAMSRFPQLILGLCAPLALTACGDGKDKANPNAERDPAVSAALSDPIMADPDLAQQNRGAAALAGGGPAAGEIPPDKRTPEEIEAARSAALDLMGGMARSAPSPETSQETSRLASAASARAVAETLGLGGAGCAAALEYSAIWAARLPAALPVYPRGHVGEVAGSDKPGCRLRVVGFVTPVDPQSVLDFYYTGAGKAKLPVTRAREGEDEVLRGGSANAGYALYVRKQPNGLTFVQMVTSGL